MKLVLTIAGFAAVAAFDLRRMIKNGARRDIAVYSVIFLLVFALALLMAFDVKIPSPIEAAHTFYQDILHLAFKPPE